MESFLAMSSCVFFCFFFGGLVSAPTMLFRSICWLWKALVQTERGQELRLSCLWSSIFIRTRRSQKPLMGQEAVSYCLTSESQKWDTLSRECAQCRFWRLDRVWKTHTVTHQLRPIWIMHDPAVSLYCSHLSKLLRFSLTMTSHHNQAAKQTWGFFFASKKK